MGTTYRAAHPYDCFTAVKRLHDSQPLGKQFRSELIILAKFRHMNIIPLLGFCIESGERLLVYKYMPNETFLIMLENNIYYILKTYLIT